MKVFVCAGEVLTTTEEQITEWNGVVDFPFSYVGTGEIWVCTLASDGASPAPLNIWGTGVIGGWNDVGQWYQPVGRWASETPTPEVGVLRGDPSGPLVPGVNHLYIHLDAQMIKGKIGIEDDIWLVGNGLLSTKKIDVGVPLQQFQIGVMPSS